MEVKFVILSIEGVQYNEEEAILIMANKVEEYYHSFLDRLFRKKFYKYSITKNEGTFYFVFPFSNDYKEFLIKKAKSYKNEDFWSIYMETFEDEDIVFKGKIIHAKIHVDLKEALFYGPMENSYHPYCDENVDKMVNEIEDKELDNAIGHPARPDNIPITKENQRTYYKAYHKCPDYHSKMQLYVGDKEIGNDPFASKAALCKQDCLFPTCPFYDFWTVNNRFNPTCNHIEDYDEWIVLGYKNR